MKYLLLYVLLVLCAFLPALASVPFAPWDTSLVIKEVLVTTSLTYPVWLRILIHASTVVLFALLFRYGRRIGRLADAFFGVLFLFYAFSQNIAVTPTYGLAIVTGNLLLISVVGLSWLWEAYRPQNEYVFHRLPLWRYWVVPFALLAFWFPYGLNLLPDFNPLLLLTSDFGVMFCPTAPVIIALLTLVYPHVHKPLLTVTSLVGLLIGLFNALAVFTMPGYTLWMFFLHTPLLFVSFYGLIIPWLVRSNPPQE
jgi:hypothetical protein